MHQRQDGDVIIPAVTHVKEGVKEDVRPLVLPMDVVIRVQVLAVAVVTLCAVILAITIVHVQANVNLH